MINSTKHFFKPTTLNYRFLTKDRHLENMTWIQKFACANPPPNLGLQYKNKRVGKLLNRECAYADVGNF